MDEGKIIPFPKRKEDLDEDSPEYSIPDSVDQDKLHRDIAILISHAIHACSPGARIINPTLQSLSQSQYIETVARSIVSRYSQGDIDTAQQQAFLHVVEALHLLTEAIEAYADTPPRTPLNNVTIKDKQSGEVLLQKGDAYLIEGDRIQFTISEEGRLSSTANLPLSTVEIEYH